MRNLRPIKFTLRLSQIESDKIQARATERQIDKADYIRDYLFGKEKSVIPPVNYRTYESLTQLKTELSRWGNNLNQLTRAVNEQRCPRNILPEIQLIRRTMAAQMETIARLQLECLGETDDR
jgi:Bacterial mobilisation protein (MobC)